MLVGGRQGRARSERAVEQPGKSGTRAAGWNHAADQRDWRLDGNQTAASVGSGDWSSDGKRTWRRCIGP